jgi:1-acyl-sn-glycerol-3-phosphate acyltransferase
MVNSLFRFLFRLAGWKLVFNLPPHVKKGMFAVCPHATWYDFLVGLGSRAAMRMRAGYLGKKELFKPPFGFIFRWLDGYPVDRSSRNNLVNSIIKNFNSTDQIFFAIAPEGTRRNVGRLKTGFYYMAEGANVPIIFVVFHYPSKSVIIEKYIMPSGNIQADFREIAAYFSQFSGVQKDWIDNYLAGKFDGETTGI